MCLAVPGKIVNIKDDIATVDYELEKRKGRLIENDYRIGDYVIIQGGIIVSKIEKGEAEAALKAYKDAVS